MVIAVDFNINSLSSCKYSGFFKEVFLKYGLTLHIKVPTRKDTCIDNTISSIEHAKGKTFKLFLSDRDTTQTYLHIMYLMF